MSLHLVGLAVIVGSLLAVTATGGAGLMAKASRAPDGAAAVHRAVSHGCLAYDADLFTVQVRAGRLSDAERHINARRNCSNNAPPLRPYDPLG
jgi:hypothetical protein